jgi:hypothetical protein
MRRAFSLVLVLAGVLSAAPATTSPQESGARRAAPAAARQQKAEKIYWADEVPAGWNGRWPAHLQTVPEKTKFARTTNVLQLHEFIDTLKWNSEHVHVLTVHTSALRYVCPAVVLANPRVTTPEEAKKSGKPVVLLMGNIHPPESEGSEALQMLMRDILLGSRRHLLDNQILIVVPIFNVDGTQTIATRDGTPHLAGARTNAADFDLNRDGVKLETREVLGLYQNILNRWDPVLLYDSHRMGTGNFAYGNAYATSTVPAAHPGPRGYVWDTLFPAVRDMVRRDFGVETYTHAMFDEKWPPTLYSHDNTIWSTEAKFVVSNYGLRNRMSILTETPGRAGFERQIFGQYAYIASLLEYTNAHGREMQKVCADADAETVARVQAQAESGQLRNWLDGKYESRGKIDVLAYPPGEPAYVPGTSVRRPKPVSGPPELIRGIEDFTRSVGITDASVPRGYLIPPELTWLAEKLRAHSISLRPLTTPMKATGEQFVINRLVKASRGGYDMTTLEGAFTLPVTREFPAGTWFLDMAQPMSNAAFYYLEPQASDGMVGWGVLDATIRALGVDTHPVVYPIFKFRKEVK